VPDTQSNRPRRLVDDVPLSVPPEVQAAG